LLNALLQSVFFGVLGSSAFSNFETPRCVLPISPVLPSLEIPHRSLHNVSSAHMGSGASLSTLPGLPLWCFFSLTNYPQVDPIAFLCVFLTPLRTFGCIFLGFEATMWLFFFLQAGLFRFFPGFRGLLPHGPRSCHEASPFSGGSLSKCCFMNRVSPFLNFP